MTARALVAVVAVSAWCFAQSPSEPLGPDEVAVYRAYFSSYAKKAEAPVFLSKRLRAVQLDSRPFGNDCPMGLALQRPEPTRAEAVVFSGSLIEEFNFTLVDSKRGPPGTVLSVSEIAFDRDHRHAMLQYAAMCDDLCGVGGSVAFEKVGGQWTLTIACGLWEA
jgi:hypothetical protein